MFEAELIRSEPRVDLMSAPIPPVPNELRDSLESSLKKYPENKSIEELWAKQVLTDRKNVLLGFANSTINTDVYNDVLAIKLRLESAKDSGAFDGVPLRSYADYFRDKCKYDPASLAYILDPEHSQAKAVEEFDVAVINIRNALSLPLEEARPQVQRGLEHIYEVMYGRKQEHM